MNLKHLDARAHELDHLADGVNRMRAFMMPDADVYQATMDAAYAHGLGSGEHAL
jgi:hypothetical protein